MKGIIFTEFIEMAEFEFGMISVQRAIDRCTLTNDGAYTAVGTYDSAELHQLLQSICKTTGCNSVELLRKFGEHVFKKFTRSYYRFFDNVKDPFEFLQRIEDYIHPEVKKLYPDAELPRFESEFISSKQLELRYFSSRHLSEFAYGLIQGCMNHFETEATITITDNSDPSRVVFLITKI